MTRDRALALAAADRVTRDRALALAAADRIAARRVKQDVDALVYRVLPNASIERRTAIAFRMLEMGECLHHAVCAVAGISAVDCGGDLDPAATGDRYERCGQGGGR